MATPEGLMVSSFTLHIIALKGLRLPRLIKFFHEGFSVSSGEITLKSHT